MDTMTRPANRLLRWANVTLFLALGLVWAACDSTGVSGGGGSAPVTLSFATATGGVASSATAKAASITDEAGNSLTIETAEIVLREIEFERDDDGADCADGRSDDGDGDDSDDDRCEKVEQGPILVELPLDSNQPNAVVEAAVPEGRFDEVEFEVHKLDRDDADDAALLDETGFSEDVSIRVTGTWIPAGGTAESFTFTSDLNEDQEIEFEPPIEVTADAPKNVTFSVDVDRWFRQPNGTLVNPSDGNDDGRYEDLIEDNIESSIEGFEDDDRDGEDDDDDDEDDD